MILRAILLLSLITAPLARAADDFVNHLIVYNKGIGGQNSREGLARFNKDVLAHKPDFVFIYFGLNDALNESKFVDVDDYIANLSKMIAAARAAHITPIFADIHHVDVEALLKRHKKDAYGEEGPQKKIDRYNAALHQLAQREKVTLVEWNRIADQAMTDHPDRAIRQPDGVHLTPAGNTLLAESFRRAVPDLRDGQTIVCLGDSVTYGAHNTGAGTAAGDTYPAALRRISLNP